MSGQPAGILLIVALGALPAASVRAGTPSESRSGTAPAGELIVFEAASLKDVFAELGRRFEAQYTGTKVVANVAGSQELRTQIEHGAAADVFASADRKHMEALVAQGLVVGPALFACNEPVLVVRAGLAPPISSFAELPRAERIVVGTPEVPIGAYSLQILRNAAARLGPDFSTQVAAKVVSRELNVRQVLAKVTLGEADAGIVYRSDVRGAQDKVSIVAIPANVNVVAEYPIAALRAAPHPDLAQRWIELVRSPAGASALQKAGFVPCTGR